MVRGYGGANSEKSGRLDDDDLARTYILDCFLEFRDQGTQVNNARVRNFDDHDSDLEPTRVLLITDALINRNEHIERDRRTTQQVPVLEG